MPTTKRVKRRNRLSKVTRFVQREGNSTKVLPAINLRGRILTDSGFEVDMPILITYGKGYIVIQPAREGDIEKNISE